MSGEGDTPNTGTHLSLHIHGANGGNGAQPAGGAEGLGQQPLQPQPVQGGRGVQQPAGDPAANGPIIPEVAPRATAVPNPLIADQSIIDRVRAAADEVHIEKPRARVELPPIIQGHKGNLHTIPSVIKDMVAKFYLAYSALTPKAHEHHAKGEEAQAFAIGPDGSLVVKPLTRKGNHAIEETDWNLVSHIAVSLTRKYHGNAQVAALEAHNQVVQELAVNYGWAIAREYDVPQREILAAKFQHDIPTLNLCCLSTIAIHTQLRLVQQNPAG